MITNEAVIQRPVLPLPEGVRLTPEEAIRWGALSCWRVEETLHAAMHWAAAQGRATPPPPEAELTWRAIPHDVRHLYRITSLYADQRIRFANGAELWCVVDVEMEAHPCYGSGDLEIHVEGGYALAYFCYTPETQDGT